MRRGTPIEVVCHFEPCSKTFTASLNEVKRGWGKYCSRACKCEDMKNKSKPKTRKPRIKVSDGIQNTLHVRRPSDQPKADPIPEQVCQ